MAKKNVADLLVDTLALAAVERIYGLAGDSLNGITDAIRRHKQIGWIPVRHEETAAFAAGAEAHLTGRLAALPDQEALARLSQLRGVGRWTAEYVLLRRLVRLHVFPGDDVGARNNLQGWLGLEQQLDYAAVARVLARWQPYQGLVYFHLLLDRLTEAGHLRTGTPTGGMTT